MEIVIIVPVYDDWESLALLHSRIEQYVTELPETAVTVLIVDDGSNRQVPVEHALNKAPSFNTKVLRLRRNLGHQRAIAVALTFVQQNLSADAVVVMDADGEDRPEDVPRLIKRFADSATPVAVFAERGLRIETFTFKIFYQIYKLMHFVLTGRRIKFGNFSLLPRQHLDSLVVYPELWNHYAAAVLRSGLPIVTIRADRGKRVVGKSKMNFVNLVIHGLSALFANYEIVSTRMLVGTAILALIFSILLIVVVGVRLFTHLAIPGWATFTSGLLFILLAQSVATLLTVVFSAMMSRNSLGFLPIRDYKYFIAECVEVGTQ